jgi:hypothetical protein
MELTIKINLKNIAEPSGCWQRRERVLVGNEQYLPGVPEPGR